MKIYQLIIVMFLEKIMKIKDKLIHLLGGFTKKEYDSALTKLTESHDALRASLRALEHAVEDSRMTGQVNIVRTEKPIHTLKIENIILEEAYEFHPEDEIIERAKQYTGEQLFHTLMESKLIDFRVSDDFGKKKLTGTIYVREP